MPVRTSRFPRGVFRRGGVLRSEQRIHDGVRHPQVELTLVAEPDWQRVQAHAVVVLLIGAAPAAVATA
jgi:hypothetical protein